MNRLRHEPPALTKRARPPGFPAILKLLSKNLFFWSGKRTTFFGLRRSSKNFMPDLELLFEWLRSGEISVPVKATFRLEEIRRHIGNMPAVRAWAPL